MLTELLQLIRQVLPEERALVALDGFDGAGKSRVSAELTGLSMSLRGRPIHPVTIDGFLNPMAIRRGAGDGPEGFYRSSYDYDAFRELVVDRFRAGRPIIGASWDGDADEPVPYEEIPIDDKDAIIVADGIFLQRPELAGIWDASVWLRVPLSVSVPRGNQRYPGPHDPDPEAPSNHRYVGGQRLYLAEADPEARATWILDNTDLDRPYLVER